MGLLKKGIRYGKNKIDRPDLVATWSKVDSGDVISLAGGAIATPSGLGNAIKIAGDSTSGAHGVTCASFCNTNDVILTVKFYAGTKSIIYMSDNTVANGYAYASLATGLVGTIGASAIMHVRPLGGGWYRGRLRVRGTSATHTFQFGPVDADGSTTMTGGDGSTANLYFCDARIQEVMSVPDNDGEFVSLATTDQGEAAIAGFDGAEYNQANVSSANKARTTQDKVLLVQEVSPTGALVKDVNILQVGGHTASHNTGTVDDGTIRVTPATDVIQRVSKDSSANATGNRIWATVDQDMIAGVAINVGSGAAGATGTQRTVTASDSPEVTSLALLANAVGTDGSAVPSKALAVGGTDGTNLQTLSTDSAGVVYNQPAVDAPGDDSTNDRKDVYSVGHQPFTMSPQVTASVTAGTEILSATVIAHLNTARLWIYNSSAAAFTACTVYVRNFAGREYAFDTTTFATLGATTLLSLALPAGVYSIRAIASSGTASASEVEITGNL
jgi:hypothetical protein